MGTITEDGAEVTFIAVYWRYQNKLRSFDHDSVADALAFLFAGEDSGSLSIDSVTDAAGNAILDFQGENRSAMYSHFARAYETGGLDDAVMKWAGARQITD